ncbi:hypothetical protein [Bacillus licheniformis]|uniref:hypothetical protein n=1 Tax=Bacillus licheniformis TaxID=1402 RepID=UPI00092A4E14|nr:hypothetical protein [Bacillus licheniformis]OJT70480.1 hypothetical protein BFP46_07845 [Bacillus licheniformis]
MAKKDEDKLVRYMVTFNKHDPFDADVIKFLESINNRSNFMRNLLLHYVWATKNGGHAGSIYEEGTPNFEGPKKTYEDSDESQQPKEKRMTLKELKERK